MTRKWIVPALLLSLCAPAAKAGWLGDVVLGTGSQVGERAVRETADSAYDAAKGAIVQRGESASREAPVAGAPAASVPAKAGIRPGDVFSRRDFVRGDRVLFFDDFRDASPGSFPRRWTLKGPDRSTEKAPLEVAAYGGRNWVRHRPSRKREDVRSILYARIGEAADLPERFTVEFDAVLPPYDGTNQCPDYRLLLIRYGKDFRSDDFCCNPANVARIGACGASAGKTTLPFERGDGQVHRFEVDVDGRSVRVYLDGELVASDPEGIVRPVTVVGMEMAWQTGADFLPLMFTNFRLAAFGPATERPPSHTSRSAPAQALRP